MKLPENSSRQWGLASGFLAALIWGIVPVISRYGVHSNLNAYDIVAIRFLVSGLLLLPVFLRFKIEGISLFGAIALATGAGIPYSLVMVLGLSYANAGHGGLVIPSFNIVFSTIGMAVLLGVIPTKQRLFGISFILIGCFGILFQSMSNNSVSLTGDIMFVFAGFIYAIYTVASQRYKISAIHAVAIVSVLSMVVYLPLYISYFPKGIETASVADIAIQAVFQGVLTSIIAIFLFSNAINILGGSKAVMFLAVMPVSSMLFAIPVLNEWPTTLEWSALFFIAFGICIALELFGSATKSTAPIKSS